MNHSFEQVFHFTKTGHVGLNRLAIGVKYEDAIGNMIRNNATTDRRCGGDVWFMPYETVTDSSQKYHHPATFPVELAERCIKLHGIENDTVVLDPFCGTGSTLVASKNLGVRGIGIDVDAAYCNSTRERTALVP